MQPEPDKTGQHSVNGQRERGRPANSPSLCWDQQESMSPGHGRNNLESQKCGCGAVLCISPVVIWTQEIRNFMLEPLKLVFHMRGGNKSQINHNLVMHRTSESKRPICSTLTSRTVLQEGGPRDGTWRITGSSGTRTGRMQPCESTGAGVQA